MNNGEQQQHGSVKHGTGFAAVALLLLAWNAAAETPARTAGGLVAGLYEMVSSEGGQLPDWDKVRDCFLKEAVFVLRTSRTETATFSLEGFIKDFVDFYERPYKTAEGAVLPREKGFREKVIRMKVWEYGDMAHVLVLYEARILGISRPPQQGVDSWLLARRDGRWFVAAVTNETVAPDRPVPPELRAKTAGSGAGALD